MSVKVEGKRGISATVVAHSVTEDGKEIITFNRKYGLIIHAEMLRHRPFSHCVKSNRAIPTKKIREEVLTDPYVPVFFGKNQAGMVSVEACKPIAEKLWRFARFPAVFAHWLVEKVVGGHKEWANRLLNPWQWVRDTCTVTDPDNFYNLRLHSDAQRDIGELAKVMYEAHQRSIPKLLKEGEWHVPYVETVRKKDTGVLQYLLTHTKDDTATLQVLTLEEALQCSAARCARSSYDKHDGTKPTKEDDFKLYQQLITSRPVHASPAENQATPITMKDKEIIPVSKWQKGVTHFHKDLGWCSGNLSGWVQHRQLIDGNVVYDYQHKQK